jgi:hypothetical protein
MRRMKKFRLPVAVTVAVCTAFGTGLQGSPVPRGSTGAELQAGRTPSTDHGTSAAGHEVDLMPLKPGTWEISIYRGTQVVYGPVRQQLCPDSLYEYFFPWNPPTENLGRVFPDEMISFKNWVWQLPDGRYRFSGALGTSRGGEVRVVHLFTLHGDDHYEDELTVRSHVYTHPVKHVYTGSGHWVAPASCSAPTK